MIGLFDSGLGGLTVLRQVRAALPLQDIVFFADQAHVPYGERSADDLVRLVRQNLGWLDRYGVDAIVMACNTSCAIAEQHGWPPVSAPVIDLIESAAIAVERTGLERIGVIATTATTRSGAYGRQIVRRIPTARVVEIGAPALVPLVEAGLLQGEQPLAAVRDVCALLPRDVEAVILACTHYPLLDSHFAQVLGPDVARIDPAIVQAERAAAFVTELGVAAEGGVLECVTNGDPIRFGRSLETLIGDLAPRARHIDDGVSYGASVSKTSAVPET